MEKKLQETNIPLHFSEEGELTDLYVDSNTCVPMGKTIFKSIGDVLAIQKRKDMRKAITFRDVDSNLLVGVIVGYQGADEALDTDADVKEEVKEEKETKTKGKKGSKKKAKEEEVKEESVDTGNWYLEFVFDEEDLKGDDIEIIPSSSQVFITAVETNLAKEFSLKIKDTVVSVYSIIDCFMRTLLYWLDQNAKEKEEVTVILENYFEATVVVEDGEKVKSITPIGSLKRAIKGDVDLQK